MIVLLFFIPIFVCYSILIFYYWQTWISIPNFTPSHSSPSTSISIIIAARNEEENIGRLLKALQQQTYPKNLFEIIVVNDHSTDKTTEIVTRFAGVKLLTLQHDIINSYKKKAIETGIMAASGELIVTTDADCVAPPEWLHTLASFKEKTKAGFIVAPVVVHLPASLHASGLAINFFQAMDFMVLQGITAAAAHKKIHSMCNGANLAYEKKMFYDVDGFAGIDHIASGDDMLLMHKIAKKYPDRIHYLKSTQAIISTEPVKTWPAFFNQRIRWASKATHYDDKRIFWVLLLVYLFNLCFGVLLVAGFWNSWFWFVFLIAWMLKTAVELPFFYCVSQFFNKQSTVKYFFFFQPLHIFYTIVSGLWAQLGKYEWKGRKVS